jgi:glycosyltransferase involved in cell wall biosynthesis
MRIAHVTINTLTYERRILNQLQAAREINAVTCCYCLGLPGEARHDTMESTSIHRVRTRYYRGGPLKFLVFNLKVFFYLLFKPVQIIHAHDLWVLPAASLLAVFKNCGLVYDAHEYYSGLRIFNNRPIRRKVWMLLERIAIPVVDHLFTVSEPLLDLYLKRYPAIPSASVLKNVPVHEKVVVNKSIQKNKIRLLFHGQLKPGRGLIQAINSVKELENAELHIIGDGEFKIDLLSAVQTRNLSDRVFFYPPVPVDELIQTAARYDIGLVLFEADSLNYSYALPNKFFEYLMAGLPVIVSNIETLSELTKRYQVGIVVDLSNNESLPAVISEFVRDGQKLQFYHQNALQAASELNWDNEKVIMLQVYDELVK